MCFIRDKQQLKLLLDNCSNVSFQSQKFSMHQKIVAYLLHYYVRNRREVFAEISI